MPLVKKVGCPPVRTPAQEPAGILQQVIDLKNAFVRDYNPEPKIVVEEKIVEKKIIKEVIKEVAFDNPELLQTVEDLQLENQSIQRSLSVLDNRTKIALQTAHLRILALETTLEQTSLTASRRKAKLDKISETTQGRWPFMLKRTIRTLL